MILFRAMSEDEYQKTFNQQSPSFIPGKKSKFFSHDLNFIKERVQDGRFSKSHLPCKQQNYIRIVKFVFSGIEYFTQLNKKEWMLNVRKSPMVGVVSLELVT